MAITVSDLKVTLRGQVAGQRWQSGCWYRITGAAFLTATLLGVAEAYWNDIKTTWRTLQMNTPTFTTDELFIEEEGTTGQYATYPIPSAEQTGLRSLSGGMNLSAPFNAFPIRQTVGSRVTRPGQKRYPGVGEQDQNDGSLNGTVLALLGAFAPKVSGGITLGAPVATGVMWAEVCRVDPTTRLIIAKQDVSGFFLPPYVTSQVSRKIGRGI